MKWEGKNYTSFKKEILTSVGMVNKRGKDVPNGIAYANMFSENPKQLRMSEFRDVRKCLPRDGTKNPKSSR